MDSLGTDFDALLTRGATIALLGAAGWAVLVVVAVAVEARSRGRIRLSQHTGCPPAVRLWLLGVFVAVLAGAAPANASDVGAGPGAGTAVDAALDGLPLPDRQVDGAAPDRGATPSPAGAVAVVRPGDSLWTLARAHLPHAADDATVAHAVAELYAANRTIIGPDPDLVRPGQHLVFPTPSTFSEES